ncbi:Conserved protein of unknown function [Magnetospira sp. QH-2]|nr:Conserved protein of unknown function [Magnetospira sp. QH-2]
MFMFGFSFPKLLFTALAIAAVWYGFKYITRLQERRDQAPKVRRGKQTGPAREASVEDMIQCEICGDFLSGARPRSCGRKDCPYPG